MSRSVNDLELLLDHLIVEHRKLLSYVQDHAAAMKQMDLPTMESLRNQQDACRVRIRQIDARRRSTLTQMMREQKLTTEPTLAQIAHIFPLNAATLLGKRDVLRALAAEVSMRTNVASKLAAAVLGHLNVAVKAIASAVQHAGVYTKNGVPRVAPRIGAMEAVG